MNTFVCPRCRAKVPASQRTQHMQAHRNAEKPSPAERGYGQEHRKLRKQWEPLVARGTVVCARGENCLHRARPAGALILPGEDWDLGHDDTDPAHRRYSGPEHLDCNRATARWRALRAAGRLA